MTLERVRHFYANSPRSVAHWRVAGTSLTLCGRWYTVRWCVPARAEMRTCWRCQETKAKLAGKKVWIEPKATKLEIATAKRKLGHKAWIALVSEWQAKREAKALAKWNEKARKFYG